MPYPQPFLRHTLLFDIGGGEVANTSCAWDNDGGGILASPGDAADMLEEHAEAMWAGLKSSYAPTVKFLGSRVAWIGVNGLTVETLERAHAPIAGTNVTGPLPTEVAVVASLKTATYGRRGRGRMYFPNPCVAAVDGNGRLAAASAGSFRDSIATYLAGDTVGAANYFAAVQSGVDQVLRKVTVLSVGDVFDAQRRRRDNLSEVVLTSGIA